MGRPEFVRDSVTMAGIDKAGDMSATAALQEEILTRTRLHTEMVRRLINDPTVRPAELAGLRALLWHAAGPRRETAALRDAWRICAAWADSGWQARLAKALLRAMRLRRRSLGAHWREDRGCPS